VKSKDTYQNIYELGDSGLDLKELLDEIIF
jgi:hypothetical protein